MMKRTRGKGVVKPRRSQGPIDRATPLHQACLAGNKPAVLKLIQDGAVVDAVEELGQTPLFFASRKGHLDIVKVLVENGSNVNHECAYPPEETSLIQAANFHHQNVVAYLMRKGGCLGQYHLETFRFIGETMRETAAQLIEFGAIEINPKDVVDGVTYLHEAATRGWFDMAKAMLVKGTAVNAVSYLGSTPLHDVRDSRIARLLIDHGANVNATNNCGMSPLQEACLSGNEDVAVTLYELGGNVLAKVQNENSQFSGKTALDINPNFNLILAIGEKLNRVTTDSEVKSEKLEEMRRMDAEMTSEVKRLRLENQKLKKELATVRMEQEILRKKMENF